MGRSVHTAFLEIDRVLDALLCKILLQWLVRSYIYVKALAYFKGFFSCRSFYAKFGGVLSSPPAISQRVPQGCVFSPLLFNIALVVLLEWFRVFDPIVLRLQHSPA